MLTSNIKVLAISDIHLGHRKTATRYIIDNLKRVINKDLLSEIDLIVIAGDLFDHALGFSDEDTLDLQRFLILLLSWCSTYNVALRVLEGTPLHDRKQSRHLGIFNNAVKFNVDYKYVDKVFIEKNEKFNLNFLYVPDEWHPDADNTWVDVKQVLSESNLDKVDLVFMHGMFTHQLPPACPVKPHVNSRYENITDRFIIIGHVHQSSKKGKIIAPGSFDRLRHGEEERKGCWKLELNKNKKLDTLTFLENKGAKSFITVDCSSLGFDAAIEKVSVLDAITDSYIRIRAFKSDNALAILEWCKKNFFQYHWTLQVMDNSSKSETTKMMVKQAEVISITPNSIINLLNKKMLENNVEGEIVERALKLIPELKG